MFHLKGRVIAAAAFAVSVAIVIAAWPLFIGGAIMAPHQSLLREIARGEQVRPTQIRGAETSLQVARTWFDYGKFATAYGGLRLVSARRATLIEDQRVALADAEDALREGLSRVPGQPYAWLQLAQVEYARNRRPADISRYLQMSLDLAPWEHRLVTRRLTLALQNWRSLDPALRARLPGQFARSVDTDPITLATATRRAFRLREVRDMLSSSKLHLDRFNIVYFSRD